MRAYIVKMTQILNRSAEIEVEAMSEQDAIEKAEQLVMRYPERYWDDHELEDQYLEDIEEV
jgi:hypothetical protein